MGSWRYLEGRTLNNQLPLCLTTTFVWKVPSKSYDEKDVRMMSTGVCMEYKQCHKDLLLECLMFCSVKAEFLHRFISMNETAANEMWIQLPNHVVFCMCSWRYPEGWTSSCLYVWPHPQQFIRTQSVENRLFQYLSVATLVNKCHIIPHSRIWQFCMEKVTLLNIPKKRQFKSP